MHEINVTPFVDVMLVLLIVFMVTAPLLLSGLPVELPDTQGAAAQHEQGAADHQRASARAGFTWVQPRTAVALDEIAGEAQGHRQRRLGGDRSSFRGDKAGSTTGGYPRF